MNYVYFKENGQYVKVNNVTGKIKLRRDYPYIYIPMVTPLRMMYLKMMWKYASDIENAIWFGSYGSWVCTPYTTGGLKSYIKLRS